MEDVWKNVLTQQKTPRRSVCGAAKTRSSRTKEFIVAWICGLTLKSVTEPKQELPGHKTLFESLCADYIRARCYLFVVNKKLIETTQKGWWLESRPHARSYFSGSTSRRKCRDTSVCSAQVTFSHPQSATLFPHLSRPTACSSSLCTRCEAQDLQGGRLDFNMNHFVCLLFGV